MKPTRSLRFPPFVMDTANACLWRGAKIVRLTPKAFAVLQYLAERPGQLVTKDAMLEAVWPTTAVGDAVLKVCVREIRRALGDRAAAPRFVATVHRLGYRFIAAVADPDEASEPAMSRPGPPPHQATPLPRVGTAKGLLVDRGSALDRLQMCLDAAWRGSRQMVFVTGEVGSGRTALVRAFLDRVAADPRVTIAQGECVETYGSGEAYLPVLGALARLCREDGKDHFIPPLRRRAPTWLAQMPWLLDALDRDALQRELLGATNARMLREMAELLEAWTSETPLVLVLEDLHWSDAATLDLLTLIANRPEPARLLVIGTYRPDDTAGAAPIARLALDLEQRGHASHIALALLGEEAIAEYLRQRFPSSTFSAELARPLHRRTEGNPLFMVTVVDDMVARGLIVDGDQGWEVRARPDEVERAVPESLRHMIDRQIGRIEPADQSLLEAGSVAGMEFSAASATAAVGGRLADVEDRLDALARRQIFIRSLGPREWPDRTVATRYAFVHALHRNTLYERVAPARRRALHTVIGEREQAGHADRTRDVAPELAVHFEQGGVDALAVRYLREAAETAMSRHANREAIRHLTRARDIAGRLPDDQRVDAQLGCLEQLGVAYRLMGDATAASHSFAALAAAARDDGRPAAEARALLLLSSALSWIDRDRSLAAAEQALRLAPVLDDAVLRAHVRGYAGVQRILARGWDDADADACREAIEVARRARDGAVLSLLVGHHAYLLSHRADYRAAARTAELGLRLALETGDAYHYMTCQFHRAWALLHHGEWGHTRRILRDGLEMAERNGHHLWARAFRFQTAWLLVHVGDFERARAICERELEPVREPRLGELLGSIVLGFARLGLAQYASAVTAFEEVAARAEGPPVQMDWILNMPLRLGLAECWLARHAPEQAREQAKRLCRLAATSGERTYQALGRLALAEAATALRDTATAEREMEEALRSLEGHDLPLAEWRVCAAAAASDQARGQSASADAHRVRSAAARDRLTASLTDEPDLREIFASRVAGPAVLRRMAR